MSTNRLHSSPLHNVRPQDNSIEYQPEPPYVHRFKPFGRTRKQPTARGIDSYHHPPVSPVQHVSSIEVAMETPVLPPARPLYLWGMRSTRPPDSPRSITEIDDYMSANTIACLFCCWCTAIQGIVLSTKCNRAKKEGKYRNGAVLFVSCKVAVYSFSGQWLHPHWYFFVYLYHPGGQLKCK